VVTTTPRFSGAIMPRAIDDEKFGELKTLDFNNPPTKNIPHESFPKMVYLHPKDKTKTHLHKVVNDSAELEAAEKVGWKTEPHNPVAVAEDLSERFEAEPVKRGPGRPANAV
jgi:hypothetical protein